MMNRPFSSYVSTISTRTIFPINIINKSRLDSAISKQQENITTVKPRDQHEIKQSHTTPPSPISAASVSEMFMLSVSRMTYSNPSLYDQPSPAARRPPNTTAPEDTTTGMRKVTKSENDRASRASDVDVAPASASSSTRGSTRAGAMSAGIVAAPSDDRRRETRGGVSVRGIEFPEFAAQILEF